MAAAAPLDRTRREAFLVDMATELSRLTIIGPGNVARTCREVQARNFDPPLATEQTAPRHQQRKVGA
jgi:hypothetical protein